MQLKFRYPDKPIETGPNVVAAMSESQWLAQKKYDGWRCLIYTDENNNPQLFSRTGRVLDQITKVPETIKKQVQKLAAQIPPLSALDSEFVGPRGSHEPNIYLLDTLAWSNQWLVNTSYEQRWQKCTEFHLSPNIHLAETFQNSFLDAFNKLKDHWISTGEDLYEGIVLKSRFGKLQLSLKSSKKSNVMFKLKFRDLKIPRY